MRGGRPEARIVEPLNAERRECFRRDGYLVFDSGAPDALLDQIVSDFAPYWHGRRPWLVPDAGPDRILDGWLMSRPCRELATEPTVLAMLEAVYGRRPLPFQTLNFPVGSEQRPHADTVHFSADPEKFMCGVWVALEAVGEKQGPVEIYPGSHRWDEVRNRSTELGRSIARYPDYESEIADVVAARGATPHRLHLRKGQAVLWAASLLHGGSRRLDRESTRHSQVTHYFFEGCTHWRPLTSERTRQSFTPLEIRRHHTPSTWAHLARVGLRRILGGR